MWKQTFKEMQQEIFEDFRIISEKFEENNIFWWAHSGTLLGFVREKGMISWDDDIDMGMNYKDFNDNYELIKEIVEVLGYNLTDPVNTPGVDTIKLVKKKKRIVEWNEHKTIFKPTIDIMLAIPHKGTETVSQGKRKTVAMNISNIFNSTFKFLPSWGWFGGEIKQIPRIYGYLISPFKPFLYPFSVMVVKRNFKKSLKKDNWDIVAMYYNYGHKSWFYKKDEFTTIDVDGIKVNVSKDYIKELELWFGNWKDLPPVEEQVPHHLLLYKERKSLGLLSVFKPTKEK